MKKLCASFAALKILLAGVIFLFPLNGSCDFLTDAVDEATKPDNLKSLAAEGVKKLFTPQVLPDYPQDPLDDKAISDYSTNILAGLEPYALHQDFSVEILKTAKVNGFSSFDVHRIEITRGLLNMMRNEAELACLIGHEIGHVDLGHDQKVYRAGSADQAQSKGIVLIGRALGQGQAADAADYANSNMTIANYGQQLEQDADEYGAVLAAKAGYDPYAFVDLFNRLAQKRGTGLDVHLNALTEGHKSSDARAKHLLEFLKAKGYKPGRGFRREKEFQVAMADLQTIRTGEGDGGRRPEMSADAKKDAADLSKLYDELKQGNQDHQKIKPDRFLQIARRLSDYFQKYHVTRERLRTALASSDKPSGDSSTADHKEFMDDDMGQDYPFLKCHPWAAQP